MIVNAYSSSSLSCFKSCPRKFKFTYIDKPEIIKKESIEAFLGNRVHDALEKLYKDVMINKSTSLDEIIEFYRQVWNNNWNEKIVIRKKENTSENYKKTGEEYICAYYQKHHPFDRGTVLELETNICFHIDSKNKYKIRTILDRIMKVDVNYYEIHDYKTTSNQYYYNNPKNDIQLPLYQFALMSKYQDANRVDLVWHYLKYGEEIRICHPPEHIESIRKKVVDLITKIENETVFRTIKTPLCGWCDYIELCPAN